MSAWDEYISNMQVKGLQLGGIYSKDGHAWAQSADLRVEQQEVKNLVAAIPTQNFPDGFQLSGSKYTVIVSSDDSVTAKCRKAPTEAGKYLVHIALAKTCVVVGGMTGAGERGAYKIVEEIRDHLAKAGY